MKLARLTSAVRIFIAQAYLSDPFGWGVHLHPHILFLRPSLRLRLERWRNRDNGLRRWLRRVANHLFAGGTLALRQGGQEEEHKEVEVGDNKTILEPS